MRTRAMVLILVSLLCIGAPLRRAQADDKGTFDAKSMTAKAEAFFGSTSKGLATVIAKVFREQGRPDGYIEGSEASGAIGVGLIYGKGVLHLKRGGGRKLFWTGPSLGFDFGANASKVFVLVYHLRRVGDIFQRFPAVDGSFYYVAGAGVNYQRSGDITLAPIRVGVGLRAGVNIGYVHYTRERSWLPF